MAISDIYNSLTFGGVNSLDYGVYISGPAVYDAPTRSVEFVDVPGRNGAIEIDNGHWNNIEVTYRAGLFGDDQTDFASKINAFRNAIVSQIGYQRITDTYNPDEYRLGIYASGLAVGPVNYNEAGEFDLIFNCKPQRYLVEGETPITVTSGDTITNPTLYESGPLLAVEGYGNINLGNNQIALTNEVYGDTLLVPGGSSPQALGVGGLFDNYIWKQGDSASLDYVTFAILGQTSTAYREYDGSPTLSITNNLFPSNNYSINYIDISERRRVFLIRFDDLSFTLNSTGRYYSCDFEISVPVRNPPYDTATGTITGRLMCNILKSSRDRKKGIFTAYTKSVREGANMATAIQSTEYMSYGDLRVNSTVSSLGAPTYIDLEIGNAYKIENDDYIDLNKYVALPSDLPKLNLGGNEITFNNTITDLKITPRWWEL